MFKAILVATDGSADSLEAVNAAAAIAKQHQADKIGVVHVVPDPQAFVDGYAVIDATYWNRFYEELRSTGQRLTNEAKDAIAKTWSGAVETYVQEGNIVNEIVKVAEQGGYDLLIVGQIGRAHV